VVFAGVDYRAILARAETEADVILWDGGNNDFPFVRPDLHIVLVDALRPDQLTTHHPGEAVLRMADVVVVAKTNAVDADRVAALHDAVRAIRPTAAIVDAASAVTLDDPGAVRGRRVLIVEDGPTITHGGMAHGAGYAAVAGLDGVTIVDPRTAAAGSIAAVYRQYPHIGPVLPAAGYSADQRRALAETIDGSGAEVVVAATPIDLARIVDLDVPVVRVRYDYADHGTLRLTDIVDSWADGRGLGAGGGGAG
jgi:predicted GTPase